MLSWSWADTNQVQATSGVLGVIVTFVGFLLLWRQIKQVDLSTRAETHGLFIHAPTFNNTLFYREA